MPACACLSARCLIGLCVPRPVAFRTLPRTAWANDPRSPVRFSRVFRPSHLMRFPEFVHPSHLPRANLGALAMLRPGRGSGTCVCCSHRFLRLLGPKRTPKKGQKQKALKVHMHGRVNDLLPNPLDVRVCLFGKRSASRH